jgi:hypothetical protein
MTEVPFLRAAIVYDFDGTLSPGNVQEHSLLPDYIGIDKDDFWADVGREKKHQDADEILCYMWLLLERARERGLPITYEVLRSHGAATPLFEGVAEWFARINGYAKSLGLALCHYVVSSGNEELIAGSSIFREFRKVFASRYAYDGTGVAVWPAVVVNYTTKTQYLFRINKGIENAWENEPVNRWQPMQERPLPFERMIYLGDGDTDIPSMKTVRQLGGHAVAVFDPARWHQEAVQSRVQRLICEDRAHFVVPADYRLTSQLDVTIRGLLGRIAREATSRIR